jgi:hypothetical protein
LSNAVTIFSNKKKLRFKPLSQNTESNLADPVTTKIEEGDVRGAARLAVSDDSLSRFTNETIDALRQLHPWRAEPVDNSILHMLSMSAEDITRLLSHFLRVQLEDIIVYAPGI